VVRIYNGVELAENGTPFFWKKVTKFSLMILSLNLLLNGPTYETNDEAKSTSPITTSISAVS